MDLDLVRTLAVLAAEALAIYALIAARSAHRASLRLQSAMASGTEDRRRLKDALGRYVSEEVVKRASSGELHLGGRLEDATVLFSDLRNFTAIAESLEPEAVVHMINRYFEAMVSCVKAEGGEVNKFLGDGMMAVFVGRTPPENAMAAIRAALAMGRSLDLFNAEQRFLDFPEMAMGVGIASGPVLIGNIGSTERLEYTAIGDVVNTASRIEGLTKELNTALLVDEATFDLLGGRVELRERGTCSLKGKSRPVQVYAPTTRG